MEKKELNEKIAVDFIHAIKSNNWDFLKHALEEYPDVVNAKTGHGVPAIIWAALYEYSNTIELLINHGADADLKDNDGRTAIMHILTSKKLKDYQKQYLVDVLMDSGANIDAVDKCGYSALAYATSWNLPKIVNDLMNRGAATQVA